MSKEITFHINNMAYTINVDETMEEQLTKYLDKSKNNGTKELLAAYIQLSQEYMQFKQEVEKISNKLSRF